MFIKRRVRELIISIVILISLLPLFPRYAMVYTRNGKGMDPSLIKRPIQVIDSDRDKPIESAAVTSGNEVEQTDERGMAHIKIEGDKVAAKAHGYLRTEASINASQEARSSSFSLKTLDKTAHKKVMGMAEEIVTLPKEIEPVPFTPKGLYLSFYGIGDRRLREDALRLLRETELNTLVIDVKGDRGMIPYPSSIPLATEVGAQKIITVKDMRGLLDSLKNEGIYTIARIVVFKDNLLANYRPDLAVKDLNGGIWRDREGLAWTDPFKREVWEYNIQIAVEAAQLGFDEIQFDYIRFPDALPVQFSMPNTMENRVNAISGFLKESRKRLLPYNVFVSADIFGYVCWNLNDTFIGQTLDAFAPHLDYLSPMLYPSGFHHGIPGYRIPTKHPYEIVYLTLKRAQERTGLSSLRFRPWLQAFRDYAFDRRLFEEREIREQIDGVEQFGSHGWLLWNPQNIYSRHGLKREGASEFAYQRPEKTVKDSNRLRRSREESGAPRESLREEALAPDTSRQASEPATMLNPVMAEQ
ncbi:MAG: putative glycoside hydrolase [Thermodesulfobacteriota bacterium]